MLVFLIVILVLAALLELISLRGDASCVDADLSLSVNRTEPDTPLVLTTAVTNRRRIPITYLTITTAFPFSARLPDGVDVHSDTRLNLVTDVYRLWMRQRVERQLTLSMECRGVYTISGKSIGRGDFLGLSVQSEHLDRRCSVIVYPRRMESASLTEALGRAVGEMPAERWLLRDPIITLGVREYTGTEPMHEISWSQTARRGELTVREFDYTRTLNCCVLFCANGITHSDTELLDRCCSAARTICETLIEHGVDAQLFTNASLAGHEPSVCRYATASQGREEEVLEILARATTFACAGGAQFAEACLAVSPDAAAYLLLVPRPIPDADAAAALITLRTGTPPLVLYADALEVDEA